MKKEYIIEVRVNNNARTFPEIIEEIKNSIMESRGIEGLTIRSKNEQ